jgi:hypothetical protein
VGNGIGNGQPPVLEGDAVLKAQGALPLPAQHSPPFAANRSYCPDGTEGCDKTPEAVGKGGYACNFFGPERICADSGALSCTVKLHTHNAKSYNEFKGKDSQGSSLEKLEGKSVPELEEACNAKPECVGFSSASGELKSAIADEADWVGIGDDGGLYVKDMSVPTSSGKTCEALCAAQHMRCMSASSDRVNPSCPKLAGHVPPAPPAPTPPADAGAIATAKVHNMTADQLQEEWGKVQDLVAKQEIYERWVSENPGQEAQAAWKKNHTGEEPPVPLTPEEQTAAGEKSYIRDEIAHRGAVNAAEASQAGKEWVGKLYHGPTTACQESHARNTDGKLEPVQWCECALK